MKPFSSEMGGDEINVFFAMLFVAWSQPAHEMSIKTTKASLYSLFTMVSPIIDAPSIDGLASTAPANRREQGIYLWKVY